MEIRKLKGWEVLMRTAGPRKEILLTLKSGKAYVLLRLSTGQREASRTILQRANPYGSWTEAPGHPAGCRAGLEGGALGTGLPSPPSDPR